MNNLIKRIEWSNLAFITLTPVLAVLGSIWLYTSHAIHPLTWFLFAFMMIMTGLGITAGYHRLFSHRSYRAHWSIQLLLLMFGGAAFEGSAREWCSSHRKHHRFVDTERDPYNIKKGFWYAHVGWVVLKADQSDESDIKDLLRDRLILWQDKHYILLSALVGFAFPMAIASLWGDAWAGLILAGLVRLVLNHHFTFFINSYCHFFGSQNYSNKNTARDSGFISLFTYGEGYHNFHHAFEHDYRNGIRVFDWDPTKWFIYLLSRVGLTSHLIRMPDKKIFELKMLKQEGELTNRIKNKVGDYWDYIKGIESARARVLLVLQRMDELKHEYNSLRLQKISELEVQLHHLRLEIENHKKEFREHYAIWKQMLSSPGLAIA